jgi:hypothetical protein
MAEIAGHAGERRGNRWRIPIWGGAAALLLTPLVAMQFSRQWSWDLSDFVIFGVMLASACGTYELGARTSGSGAYRAAVGIAVAAAFVLVWMNLAVGIIGNEDNPANLMFGGVLAVGFIGALLARFRPRGMALALVATAIAQALVGAIALLSGLGSHLPLAALFGALWLTSARLFRKAGQEMAPAGASASRTT